MSAPAKGSVIIATGFGKVTSLEPSADGEVLVFDSTSEKGLKTKANQGDKFITTLSGKSKFESSTYEKVVAFTVPGSNESQISKIYL
jgi:hypothetical protein